MKRIFGYSTLLFIAVCGELLIYLSSFLIVTSNHFSLACFSSFLFSCRFIKIRNLLSTDYAALVAFMSLV